MKRLGLWILVACLIGSAGAEAPKKKAKPRPEMRKLAKMYAGQWTARGRTTETPLEPAERWTGTVTSRPILKGFALHSTYEFKSEGSADTTHVEEIVWYDEARKNIAYLAIPDDGNIEQGTGTSKDFTYWEATRPGAKMPNKIRGKDTFAPDGNSFVREGEVSVDGGKWLPWFESKFTKAKDVSSRKTRAKAAAKQRGAKRNAKALKPATVKKMLERLAGRWEWTGEQADIDSEASPYGQAGRFVGHGEGRLIMDGLFILDKYQEKSPEGNMLHGVSLVSYDPVKKRFVARDYLSDGATSVSEFTFEGRLRKDRITITSKTGETLLARTVGEYSRDWKRFEVTWEGSTDKGKTWEHWCTAVMEKSTEADSGDVESP